MLTNSQMMEHLESILSGCGETLFRPIAVLSAIIAGGDVKRTRLALQCLKSRHIDATALYETILQSYLFLGFPRMIEAALAYNDVYGDKQGSGVLGPVTTDEAHMWYNDGLNLCRRVYGKNYERLEEKFLKLSPELFRWMVIEGYGKVLSRSGLGNIERELAEVAALIVDGRRRQLVSHLRGSLNMGADLTMIKTVLNDIRPLVSSDNAAMAEELISDLEDRDAPVL